MGAAVGNTNSIGNTGGRPPYFSEDNPNDIERLSNLCESFFEYIKGEFKEDEFEYEPGLFTTKTTWIRNPEPPTVTGLTLYLGFDCKQTLYNYGKKVEFLDPIKRALTKIEQYHEIATSMGDKCTGNIFILKNFGWKDTNVVEHSGSIDNPSAPPTIVFKKFTKDEQ